MGTATKPLRIQEADHRPLGLIAAVQGRSRSDVVHDALREYAERHRDELARAFRTAQTAIANGDLEGLTALFEVGAEARVDDHVRRIERLRSPKRKSQES